MRVVVALALLVGPAHSAYDPCLNPSPDLITGKFPRNFLWATATAAFQIEGGWNASGKGASIWDEFDHRKPSPIKGGATGDVACDSYHKWRTDIQLLKDMGLKSYRMSISWPRLLPSGLLKDGVNLDAVRYYGGIFQALQEAGIRPLVTLYHWDLPEALQKNGGGWLNAASSDWFRDYATLCFQLFGKYVPYWITFNEPWVTTVVGYSYGAFAPGIYWCPGTCPYNATHNILLAHAKAYHAYDDLYRSSFGGQVGMTMNCDFKLTNSKDPLDVAATERALQWQLGWFAHPIYSKAGDYPPIMKAIINERSIAEGRNTSRLPSFTPQQVAYVRGTFDFFGINTYTSYVVKNSRNSPRSQRPPRYDADIGVTQSQCAQWPRSGSSWLKFVPWGARGLLNWIAKEYDSPPIIVTENGWSDNNGSTLDPWRIHYYKHYINNVLKAIRLDGVDVRGYTAWSLMDNLEWASGYTEKFGLHYVDFNDPARPRKAKASAAFYSAIAKANGFTPCSFGPCVRGTCSDSADGHSFSCACPQGYAGPTCALPQCPLSVQNLAGVAMQCTVTRGGQRQTLTVGPGASLRSSADSGTSVAYKAMGGSGGRCPLSSAKCSQGLHLDCVGDRSNFGCLCA